MCCFSESVDHVSNTHIFARGAHAGRQILVCAMSVSASAGVAMVLPLPVPPGSQSNLDTWVGPRFAAAA